MSKTITCKQSILAVASLIIIYTVFFQYLDLSIDIAANQLFPNTFYYKISSIIGAIFAPICWTVLAAVCLLLGLVKRKTQLGQNYLFFAGAVLFALFLAEIFKVSLARYRPIEWFEHQFYGFHFFSNQHDFNGTPSGHTTATFAGLFAISQLRKKRGLCIVLMSIATLVGLSRIVLIDHYPSDVIFGAYLGILSVYWLAALKNKFCIRAKS